MILVARTDCLCENIHHSNNEPPDTNKHMNRAHGKAARDKNEGNHDGRVREAIRRGNLVLLQSMGMVTATHVLLITT